MSTEEDPTTADADALEADVDADDVHAADIDSGDVDGGDEVVVKARKRPARTLVDDPDDASEADDDAGEEPGERSSSARPVKAAAASGGAKQITLSVRTLVLAVVGLLVGAGLLFGVVDNLRVRHQLNDLRAEKANAAKAEQVASDYAVKAATLDYKDLTPWAANLKKGVSPELAKQFEVAVPAMSQILTPVRMSTTATLVSATTTSVAGDVFCVTAVVEVNTTSLQTPNGATSLAAYVLTLNKAADWQITAVGDQAVPGGAPRLPGMPGQAGQPGQPGQPAPAPVPAPGG